MTTLSDELKREIKIMIMTTLNIKDVDPDEVDNEIPLFSGENKLALDSVDSIEIIMAIQRKYGIRIADQALGREVVRSVNTIAGFITNQLSTAV
ncbi:MAG: phosphopantetheine-binding protein [Bacteroidota bacterium]